VADIQRVMGGAMSYGGAELVAMAEARNYYRWILGCCRGSLGQVILEHGAGVGTFSDILLTEGGIEKLLALEPAANLLPALSQRLAGWRDRVEIVPYTMEGALDRLRGRGIDTVVSVNVLEHIDDDVRTLETMSSVLAEQGRLIVFVPAVPWLYGSLDAAFEHVRRYRKQELVEKVSTAGFDVLSTTFMNGPGVLSWFVVGRILKRHTLDATAVRFYDRCVLPIVARLEGWYPPPIGQNLLLIGRRR
jgi:SAM-dependent methyltransferase